jgi:hypothetical protein
VKRADVRMIQRGDRFRFLFEARPQSHVRGEFGRVATLRDSRVSRAR